MENAVAPALVKSLSQEKAAGMAALLAAKPKEGIVDDAGQEALARKLSMRVRATVAGKLKRKLERARERLVKDQNFRRNFADFCSIVLYYVLGCAVFNWFEGWSILDSCYYMTVTMSTVGYGDVSPETVGGKIFGIFYILIGIAVIFAVIARIASALMAKANEKIENMEDDDDTDNHTPVTGKLAFAAFMLIVCLFGGALFFATHEKDSFNFLDALWWCTATVTTVGYGDLSFEKDSTKIFLIFYILITVVVGASAVGTVQSVRDQLAEEQREAELLNRLDFSMLADMDKDGNGVSMDEYVVGMALLMEDIDPKKVALLRKQFADYDKDSSGVLTKEDLEAIAVEQQHKIAQRQAKMDNRKGKGGFFSRGGPGGEQPGSPSVQPVKVAPDPSTEPANTSEPLTSPSSSSAKQNTGAGAGAAALLSPHTVPGSAALGGPTNGKVTTLSGQSPRASGPTTHLPPIRDSPSGSPGARLVGDPSEVPASLTVLKSNSALYGKSN